MKKRKTRREIHSVVDKKLSRTEAKMMVKQIISFSKKENLFDDEMNLLQLYGNIEKLQEDNAVQTTLDVFLKRIK
jgi:hypothetical protein